MQLFFGNTEIDENFLNQISEKFHQKDIIERKNFDNLEDFFRFLYCKIGEKTAKNFLSVIYNIEFLDYNKINQALCDNLFIVESDIKTYQKNLFLVSKSNNNIKIFLDYLSDEILEHIKLNFSNKNFIIELTLCEKNFLIQKQCELFKEKLIYQATNSVQSEESARNLYLSSPKNLLRMGSLVSIFLFLSFFSSLFSIFTIIIFNLFHSISIFYKIFLSYSPKSIEKIDNLEIKNFPIYTILLPILKEDEKTIKQLIDAINNIDYPNHKLDIKILIEETDERSKYIFDSIDNLKYNFDIIHIPKSTPQTKAKACNFAINFTKGEFLVIYDSDDIPHPEQLKNALYHFQKNLNISCVQAILNSYNYGENWLTQFYSIEFDLWYRNFLPKMNKLNLPITFGGTSNHFRNEILKNNPWDSWNVTEDADLGVRWWLKKLGKIEIINSQTLEEAPLSIKSWINQRSRWTKGFLQTYFVHRKHQNKKFNLWLNLFLLLPIISNLSFFFVLFEFFILKFWHQNVSLFVASYKISIIIFTINYILQLVPIAINFKKFMWKPSIKIIFFPLYSILLNIPSTCKALWQLFKNPFFWEKTTHGLSKIYQKDK